MKNLSIVPISISLLAIGLLVSLGGASATAAGETPADSAELVIYTSSSFIAPKGFGPVIFPLFEAKCGCHVRTVASGDAAQLVNRLELDVKRGKPAAQIILGLDQNTWPRAKEFLESWGAWTPAGYAALPADVRIEPGFLPFDRGIFALIADKKGLASSGISWPESGSLQLNALLDKKFRRNLIFEDPRTSTPGLAFVLFTGQIMGSGAGDFWKKLSGQWLTLTPGWSQAYGLFLKGEAPFVWSYTTSQAYHEEHGDTGHRYQAVLFSEGQPQELEGAAIVKGSVSDARDLARARTFLEFLLSKTAQEAIPKANWMQPVVEGVALPESFKRLPKPLRLVRQASQPDPSASIIKAWERAIRSN